MSEQRRGPRVSIGLPVYNGEPYLDKALNSILGQTYSDLELIISDNASTDRTPEICRAHAAQDRRVRYYRQPVDLGAVPNYNFVFGQSTGEYFKWAAHDDKIAPDFIEKCVQLLDRDPSVVLCHSRVMVIDAAGRPRGVYLYEDTASASERPSVRFAGLLMHSPDTYQIFGLIRSAVLRQTALFGSFVGSDRLLVTELSLQGKFHEIDEYLLFSREHEKRYVRLQFKDAPAWHDAAIAGRRVMWHWRFTKELFERVRRAPFGSSEKAICYRHALCKVTRRMHWVWLLLDPVIAFKPQLRSSLPLLLGRRSRRSAYRWFEREQATPDPCRTTCDREAG
jgi:glycosyltransferase involved in cell wall biosynthesis